MVRAPRDWACFDQILASIKQLEDDEPLLIQSGKPVRARPCADARRVGIGIGIGFTLLPVRYQAGGFGAVPPDALREALAGLDASAMPSSHVFASHGTGVIVAVWIAGGPRVRSGRHPLHDGASAGFVAARRRLLQDPTP